MDSLRERKSVRDFPESRTRHEDYYKLRPWDAGLLRRLFDQGLTIPANCQNLPVVHDHQFAEVLRVLLDLGSVLGPSKVFSHALFKFGHVVHLHGGFSMIVC